jgi:type II secretory pathway component PulC
MFRSVVSVVVLTSVLAIGCSKDPPPPEPDPAIAELRAEVQALSQRVAELEKNREREALYREMARRPPRPTSEPPSTEAQQVLQEALAGIVKKSEYHYLVPQKLADLVMTNPTLIARTARVVPSIKKGKPNGFKLYAIRPGSVYERVGFVNGDTLHAVNGHHLHSLDGALEAYTQVRTAKKFVVELTRQGSRVTLAIEIEG